MSAFFRRTGAFGAREFAFLMRRAGMSPSLPRLLNKVAVLQGIWACPNFISKILMAVVEIIRLSKTHARTEISPDSTSDN
jgi:hypothetical protein